MRVRACLVTVIAVALVAGGAGPAGASGHAWSVETTLPDDSASGSSVALTVIPGTSDQGVWLPWWSNSFQIPSVFWMRNADGWSTVRAPSRFWTLAMTALGPDNAWAVGETVGDPSIPGSLRWNGTRWRNVSTDPAAGPTAELDGVTMVNRHDGWAVGGNWTDSGLSVSSLIEHWDGHSWLLDGSAALPENLTGVCHVPGSSESWAVGSAPAVILHQDGTGWAVASSPSVPPSSSLNAVVCVNADDVWAVGSSRTCCGGPGSALIEHWDGASWNIVAAPPASNGRLLSVTSVPGSKVLWAVGTAGPTQNPRMVIDRYTGSRWVKSRAPALPSDCGFSELLAVSAASPTAVWATGYSDCTSTLGTVFVLRYQ